MAITIVNRTKIDTLELDATVHEEHGFEVEVTDNKVESGADVTDHARSKPATLTIEGVISDTPLEPPLGPTVDSALADAVGRSLDAMAQLIDLAEAEPHPLLTVITSIRTYENVMLTSLNIPRDKSTGEALRFTATFKRVRFATNQQTVTTIPAQAKKSYGRQAVKPAPDQWHWGDEDINKGLGGRLDEGDVFGE